MGNNPYDKKMSFTLNFDLKCYGAELQRLDNDFWGLFR